MDNLGIDYNADKSWPEANVTSSGCYGCCGTGTFIARLLQSGIIPEDRLPEKYKNEIHANELVLLAYYIAAINIEATYHGILTGNITGQEDSDVIFEPAYEPFNGICLTDTFQMGEKVDLVDELLEINSARRKRQQELDIRVIVGNPPYSVGQGNQNDNNQNVNYPTLDTRIGQTYAAKSDSSLKNSLYDSYVRAIRWASDRIGNAGVIGYVSGSSFIEKPVMSGMRKCLVEEFSNIHVLNLRGDIRKNMLSKGRAREGQNIFGSNSMTGIAITLFVKNPDAKLHGKIYYHDIGNDLTKTEKLDLIQSFGSISGISESDEWQAINPDQHGDWIGQRDDNFSKFIAIGDKKGSEQKLFDNYSGGVMTARDAWCFNPSKVSVTGNMKNMIAFYNSELQRFKQVHARLDKKAREVALNDFINTNPEFISWTVNLKQDLVRERNFSFEQQCLMPSLYRPFTKQWLYFNRTFNERVLQIPRIFPNASVENLVICVSGVGARSGFSTLISSSISTYDTLEKSQCFPLYLFDGTPQDNSGDMFLEQPSKTPLRRDAITDQGIAHFKRAYPNEQITKEDLFYYVYGILHSSDYRERFADNLSKELPRIPAVKSVSDFWAFSQAGRVLADLHLDYETIEPYPLTIEANGKLNDTDYRVEKMKFVRTKDPVTGKNVNDLSAVVYNSRITLRDIPLTAWDYVVGGKAALDWVMERQRVKTDKPSGIVNDANDWATETMANPRYPLELFQRVITMSLETMKIVRGLPVLDID